MLNDNGKAVISAVPSMPVQVTGWKDLPEAGEMLLEVESEVRGFDIFKVLFVTGVRFVRGLRSASGCNKTVSNTTGFRLNTMGGGGGGGGGGDSGKLPAPSVCHCDGAFRYK